MNARSLLLVRHARAEDPAGRPDHDRRLTDRGRADATRLGGWLKEHKVSPDAVLCSTAARARQTWAAASEAGTMGAIIEHDPRIYNASVPTLIQVLQELDRQPRTVVVVGHAPGIPALAAVLAEGRDGADRLADGMPTCTVVQLEVEVPWEGLAAGTARVTAVHTSRASDS